MKNNRFNVLDTNVILRLVTNDIPDQCERAKKLLKSENKIFFVSDLVLFECFYVLQGVRYNFSRDKVIDALKNVLALSRVDYDRAVIDLAIDFYAEHPALSFTDCYLKCFAENREMTPVWTFDKKLTTQAKGIAKMVA